MSIISEKVHRLDPPVVVMIDSNASLNVPPSPSLVSRLGHGSPWAIHAGRDWHFPWVLTYRIIM